MNDVVFTELAMNAEGKVPEWVHILPAGRDVQAVDGRYWVMSNAAKVIARSMTGVDLPIDYEHQTDDPKQRVGNGPVPAAGWIKKLEARPDGIWGQVEWTPRAKELLSAREYRYLSPTFDYNTETLEIGRITGAGLVHTPALRMTAIASEQSGQEQIASEQQSRSEGPSELIRQCIVALGLPNGSSAEDVLAAIGALKDQVTVPQNVLKEVLRERFDAISTLAEETVKSRVTQALASGYISPAMAGWATDLCRRDPGSFDAFCNAAPPMAGHLGKSQVDEAFLREHLNLGKGALEGSIERDVSSALGVPVGKLSNSFGGGHSPVSPPNVPRGGGPKARPPAVFRTRRGIIWDARMSVEFYLDLKSFEKAVTLLADPQLDRVADSIGSLLISSTAQRIADQKESPDGAPWPKWGERHAKTRRRNQSVLVQYRDLRDSIHALVTGGGFNTQVVVGTPVIYAATHQFGAPSRGIPARPFLGISYDDKARIEHLVVESLEDIL